MAIGVAYKFSTGSESGTFTVTTADTSTNDSVMILMAISGAHASAPPEVSTMAAGSGAAQDTPALSPSWGAEDTLWVLVVGSGEESTTGSFTGVASVGGGFGSYADSGITADVAGGVEAAVAFVQENTATQDPGTHGVDTTNARNSTLQLAVRPPATAVDATATPATISRPVGIPTPTVTASSTQTAITINAPAGLPTPVTIGGTTAAVAITINAPAALPSVTNIATSIKPPSPSTLRQDCPR